MRLRTSVAALILTALLSSGCLGLVERECQTQSRPDYAGQTLRVLDHGAFASFATIQPLFEARTGAKLVHVAGQDAGGALLQAIQNKGNPIADVIYGVDNLLFNRGLEAGIFEPYESSNLVTLVADVRLDDFRRDGVLYATPVDHAFVNVNYDVALASPNATRPPPQDLDDLADPNWARLLVAENPNLSSPGLAFLVITVATFGEDDDYDYLDYWKDLFEGGVLVASGWTEAYVYHYSGGYGRYVPATYLGGRSLVVSYTTSPAVEVLFGAPSPPGVSLEPPRGVFHQVETMAILKCTENLELAQAFLDFALTAEFQDKVAPEMAVYPVSQGIPWPKEFVENATLPHKLDPAPFDPLSDGPRLNAWLKAWTDLYHAEAAG